MKFREHRGQLGDSMETVKELPDRAALIDHLYASFPQPLNFENIKIEPYFMEPDVRIDWDQTYIVTLDGIGVIGFTDGPA